MSKAVVIAATKPGRTVARLARSAQSASVDAAAADSPSAAAAQGKTAGADGAVPQTPLLKYDGLDDWGAGYPSLGGARGAYITHERMALHNRLLADGALQLENWTVFNTTNALMPRPEASWDGLHFLLGGQLGGASKMVTMMLLNAICGS